MAEVLVVDDDRVMRRGLKALLESNGCQVRTARSGEEALARFREKRPDLVLLDVMMTGLNGFAVCEAMRGEDGFVPVIFLTARDGEAEKVRGLGLGADDYVSKSAGEPELIARVRRALQRAAAWREAAAGPRRACFGSVTVDFDALTAVGPGVDERLTKTEADILWLLNANRGKVVSFGEIADVVRGGNFDDATIRTHVSRIKGKLSAAGVLLVNERGAGYRLV